MNIRLILILLLTAALAGISFLNWGTLITPSELSLGFMTVQAPLGLIILVLTIALGALFLAYILWLQGTVLLDYHRHSKEMAQQRELADKAEASRFTELREFLIEYYGQGQQALTQHLDALEARLQSRADASDNSTAAYIGQLEDQLQSRQGSTLAPASQAASDDGTPRLG
ncbi:LapA family protein [Corticibacter populi]|uniref:LapA family protein n=1 Tax=Corticibacter populi TaxID=1550736 RepID=A0A3M6QK23_9BURK|nr:LapA family protein [Corticibacter populi]RMX03428.1 LapA family protein [Corticibacter populi]RZS29862.1 hypothetical protein EV687_3346 [Corticibacter populi]